MEKTITPFKPEVITHSKIGSYEFTTYNVARAECDAPEEIEVVAEDVRYYESVSVTFKGGHSFADVAAAIHTAGALKDTAVDEWTAIAATHMTDYKTAVSALVRAVYSNDDVEAIMANIAMEDSEKAEEYKAEFDKYQEHRVWAKALAAEITEE